MARDRQQDRADSPFNFIIPQVLVFVFLALTSVVAVWRDLATASSAWPPPGT